MATLELELHGIKKQLLVPVTALVSGKDLVVQGAFAFKQTDFGVKPYSVLGGVLSVQDEVSIEFELKGGQF